MTYQRTTQRFKSLSAAVSYCAEMRQIEARNEIELSSWMDTQEKHLEHGDSFDCYEGDMHFMRR